MEIEQAHAWLSEERFRPFFSASGGDHQRAVVRYQWHEELSAAIFVRIHRLEVLVRNAIDAVLGEGQPQAPLNQTWLLDFDVLRPAGLRQAIVAVERLGKGVPISRGRVVAGVSFGFWVGLFDRAYEELWRDRLHRAFPHAQLGRRDVGAALRRVHQLRNRIAHHDCLLDQDVAGVVGEMLALAGWVDPAAAGWLPRATDAEGVLARRP